MDRRDIMKRLLYPKCKSAIEFQFDTLIVNPLLTYITVQDIAQLNKIATSLKYSSKPKEKYAMIDNIMTARGFKKMASGTNRVTYRCLNDYRIVIKIAIDKVGLSDNGNEYRNQHLLKPFVTKCFEVSPCGTVGLFERVVPITSREEFVNISDDIFDLINNLIGKYVLEDIGEKFYMNYGLREGFGPVLLDYPYVFELDGRKLICNVQEPFDPKGYCGGEIDYDIGYNDLVCKKCGKRYLATELKSDDKSDKPKIIIEGDDTIMRCVLKRGDEVVSKLNSEAPIATNTIKNKKDFIRLKAQTVVKEEEKEEEYKPTIKTHDDVQLTVRLRGNSTSEDIDEKARREEAKLEAITESIKVGFGTPIAESKVEEFNFGVKLSGNEEKEDEVPEVVDEPVCISSITADNIVYDDPNKFLAEIRDNGEIWDINDDKLVGYMLGYQEYNDTEGVDYDDEDENADTVKDVVEAMDNIPVYTEDGGTSIGDLLGDKLSSFKGNENYKTTDILSPIEEHFSAVDVKESAKEEPAEVEEVIEAEVETETIEVVEEVVDSEEPVEEVVEETVVEEITEPVENEDEAMVEEVRELPELIIHPREEDPEEVDDAQDDEESYPDEELDDESDEEIEETGSTIDLY